MRIAAIIIRLLLGVVFIYSGFVKAVDPWGFQFKLEDYFIAFGWDWLMPAAMVMGILLSMAEFIIGIAFLLGIKPKLSTWSALLFMILFTPITLYLAITNAVPDCGCFGDAIILTNWETFYKNLIIIVLVGFIFMYRKKFGHYMKCQLEWVPVAIFTVAILFISFHGLRHLPLMEFLPYEPGLSMKPDPDQKDQYFVSYKDNRTGEVKEYPADDFPWDDSLWMASNEFVEQRVVKAEVPQYLVFVVDEENNDHSDEVMLNPDFQFLAVMYDLEKVSDEGFEKVRNFAAQCESAEIAIAGITATPYEDTETIRHDKQIALPFYYADDIVLKMLVRANPGFILMKDGTILGKWAWRDLPDLSEIDLENLESEYLKPVE
ncbi:MAG: DoxX family protein [Bacteroidales bacterium]|nr:DoxX family protein [Bacteroidales bacterium]